MLLSSLKNLTKYYSTDLIEEGCETLMTFAVPTLSVLKTILKRMKDSRQSKEKATLIETKIDNDYGFVRGANYFGGLRDEKWRNIT